jgi:hypothetical protein
VERKLALIQKAERLLLDINTNKTKKPEVAIKKIHTNLGTITELISAPFSVSPEDSTLQAPSIEGHWRSSPAPQPPGRRCTERSSSTF